jgi:hypothetical protein
MKAKNALQDVAQSNRRDLLGSGAAIATGLSAGMLSPAPTGEVAAQKSATADETESVQGLMPRGQPGQDWRSGRHFGPGGQGALERDNQEELTMRVIQRTLALGANYFDTFVIYWGPDRWSERYLGKGLRGSWDRVFIATKTKERTRAAGLKTSMSL